MCRIVKPGVLLFLSTILYVILCIELHTFYIAIAFKWLSFVENTLNEIYIYI